MISYPLIKRIISKARREAEEEALDKGIDITTDTFKKVLKLVEDMILMKLQVTRQDYDAYVKSMKEIGKQKYELKKEKLAQEVKERVELDPVKFEDLPDKPKIPTQEEIDAKIEEALKSIPEPKEVVYNITEPVTEKTIIQEYDATPLEKKIAEIAKALDEFDFPEPMDKEKLKEEMGTEFGKMFKQNINMMGMPNFRKLGAGLQAQIDEMKSEGVRPKTEIPTGTVDDTNKAFIFSVKPILIVVNGTSYREGMGWSWSVSTATLDYPAGVGGDVYGLIS